MDCIADLDRAIEDLSTVYHAGRLSETREAIAHALRGRPRNDLDRFPLAKADVEMFASLLADWTGLPLQLCKVAAIQHMLPETRTRDVLAVLRQYADEVRAAENQQKASTILQLERRRVSQ